MALTVEDGSGLATADAYASVSEVDTYLDLYGAPDAWSSSSTIQKEQAIRAATRYLDSIYNGRWTGRRAREEQALDWPRYNVVDHDGFGLDSDVVPPPIKHATAELALKSRSETLLPDIDEPGIIKRTRVKVGSIEDETEYLGGRSQVKKYRLVDNLVREYVHAIGRAERA